MGMIRETYKITYIQKVGGLFDNSRRMVTLVEAYDGADAKSVFYRQYGNSDYLVYDCKKL